MSLHHWRNRNVHEHRCIFQRSTTRTYAGPGVSFWIYLWLNFYGGQNTFVLAGFVNYVVVHSITWQCLVWAYKTLGFSLDPMEASMLERFGLCHGSRWSQWSPGYTWRCPCGDMGNMPSGMRPSGYILCIWAYALFVECLYFYLWLYWFGMLCLSIKGIADVASCTPGSGYIRLYKHVLNCMYVCDCVWLRRHKACFVWMHKPSTRYTRGFLAPPSWILLYETQSYVYLGSWIFRFWTFWSIWIEHVTHSIRFRIHFCGFYPTFECMCSGCICTYQLRHAKSYRCAKFPSKPVYRVQTLIVGSSEKVSRDPLQNSLLICASPYESYADRYQFVSSACWCTFEDLFIVVSKHVGSQHPGLYKKWYASMNAHEKLSSQANLCQHAITSWSCCTVPHTVCASPDSSCELAFQI